MTGDQRLALAVLCKAVDDTSDTRLRLRIRRDAAGFLASQRSAPWFRIAGVAQSDLREKVNRAVRRTPGV